MNKCKNCTMYFRDPHDLCYLAEIEEVNGDSDACERFEQANDSYDDYDPCEGCPKYDGGYNCKHCQYGDDGNYSVYDVYTPRELGLNVRW